MTKELSKQLCELCGIEPKIRYLVKIAGTEYKISKESVLKYSGIFKDTCIKIRKVTKDYPDFTKPENFVRLLEIVSRRSSVSFCHNGSYFGCSIHYYFNEIFEADIGNIQYNFLNTLLKQDLRNPCKPKLLEQLKQSIREAEWVYE